MALASPTTLAHTMEAVAQKWECLLFASGGALALKKCFWYLIVWKWEDGVPTMMTVNDAPDAAIHPMVATPDVPSSLK